MSDIISHRKLHRRIFFRILSAVFIFVAAADPVRAETAVSAGKAGAFSAGMSAVSSGRMTETVPDSSRLFSGDNEDMFRGVKSASSRNAITSFGEYEPGNFVSRKLKKAVGKITGKGFDVGFMMVDIGSQSGIAYNVDTGFYSASTIKGPYVISLLESDPDSYDESSKVMKDVIVNSSNKGYEALRKKYGSGPVRDMMEYAGVSTSLSDDDYVHLSVRDLTKLWLCNYMYLEEGKYRAQAESWFDVVRVSAIRPALGKKYLTCSKAGWISEGKDYNVTNDAGIVYAESPYILCIMTTAGADFSLLEDLVLAADAAHEELQEEDRMEMISAYGI